MGSWRKRRHDPLAREHVGKLQVSPSRAGKLHVLWDASVSTGKSDMRGHQSHTGDSMLWGPYALVITIIFIIISIARGSLDHPALWNH